MTIRKAKGKVGLLDKMDKKNHSSPEDIINEFIQKVNGNIDKLKLGKKIT